MSPTKLRLLLLCALSLRLMLSPVAHAAGDEGPTAVGVSWSNFQEERWKTDEAAIREGLAAHGARYLSADAQGSSEKQLSDVEGLIARGAQVLILLAQDSGAIHPALALARAEGIPVIAYDRLIESPGVFYISFDNVEVGRLQARALEALRPQGRYVFIKGSAQDPNSDFVHSGQVEVLRPAIEAGRIEVVGEQYVDGWLPELAQRVMEQILTANRDRVDAVVCSNDGMAGGVVAALSAQGLTGVPVSGQDGDHAALNRVARGLQTVSVWKDARSLGAEAARVALLLGRGVASGDVPGATRFRKGPRAHAVDAILLAPVPITRDNLDVVIDAGWVPRAMVCREVAVDPPPVCSAGGT
jgi:D-xylose transport system substrate-binding protein